MTEWHRLRRLVAPGDDAGTLPEGENIDWERLIELASAHGTLGVLANRLSSLDAAPPESVRQTIATRRQRSVQASLGLSTVMQSVLNRFADESIKALPFKGPVLSELAHGDVGIRQYGDVDILVNPASFDRAQDVLIAAGYQPVERLPALGEVALQSDDGWTVDLHRSVLPRYFPMSLAFEDLWARREQNDIAGQSVPTLDPTDRVVVLSVHGTKHCWYRLAWIHDLATLIAKNHADWGAVRQRSNQLRCRRHVGLGMELAHRSFDQTVPPAFQPKIVDDEVVRTLADRVETRQTRSPTAPEPPEDSEQFAVEWRAFERRTDRLRFAADVLTIPSAEDRQAIPLPEQVSWLYRGIRPLRLGIRCSRNRLAKIREQL